MNDMRCWNSINLSILDGKKHSFDSKLMNISDEKVCLRNKQMLGRKNSSCQLATSEENVSVKGTNFIIKEVGKINFLVRVEGGLKATGFTYETQQEIH